MNDNIFPSQDILQYWFVDASPDQWFKKDAAFDETLRERFGEITDKAQAGDYDGLVAGFNDKEKLALLLVLDQFSRNLYRDTARAFAGDGRALAICGGLLQRNAQKDFSNDEKLFLYLPLEHSEDMGCQELSVPLFTALGNEEYTHYAVLHYDIIKRFGRFPHRNKALGRTSTDEELQFLTEPNSSF